MTSDLAVSALRIYSPRYCPLPRLSDYYTHKQIDVLVPKETPVAISGTVYLFPVELHHLASLCCKV